MNEIAPIFHMCRADEWTTAMDVGQYNGSSQDIADGLIHFSDATQIVKSAAKHRAGQNDLVLLWVDPTLLKGCQLRWEPSRDALLFPHVYGPLNTDAVIRIDPLVLDDSGVHVFPNEIPDNRKAGVE